METSTPMKPTVLNDFSKYLPNISINNLELDEKILDLTAEDRHSDIMRIAILIVFIVLGLTGNILVVVISVFCMRLRSLTSIFIRNLAQSDLLFTVALVFRVCDRIWGFFHGDTACKMSYFFFSAGFYSSIVFLVLMSVRRYVTVVHPHTGWKKGYCFTHVLISAWMMSILAALPVIDRAVAHPDSGVCTYSSKSAFVVVTYKENIVLLCTFLFMAFCYVKILQTILKSPTNQKHRTTGLTFLLVATFFICWAPYNILIFLDTLPYDQIRLLIQDLEHFYYIRRICQLLACARCCLNPVIYGLFGLMFSKTLNSAQTANEEHRSGSYVNVNNQDSEQDINHNVS